MDFTLNDLISYQAYNVFNSENNIGSCNTSCDEMTFPYTKNTDIYKICCTIKNKLDTINLILPNNDYKKMYCKYLYYWIHEEVIKLTDADQSGKYNEFVSYLLKEWSNVVEYYTTDAEIFKADLNVMPKDSIIKRKNMFDYYNIYDIVKDSIETYKSCSNYHGYLKTIIEPYEEFIGLCSSKIIDCSDFFNPIKEQHHPKYLLGLMPCKLLDPTPKNAVSHDIQPEGQMDNSMPGSSHPSEHPYTNRSIVVILPLVGTIFLFSFLYKFSPFGLWLHKVILNKLKINRNIGNKSEHNISEDAAQSVHINSKSSQYNIAFQTL
ncbi:PIR Superfamily Protein [Plasmodium ovale wallikeri]|uniref:PIR Superfamily Protein n=2 Tax=Plasmodium ovale TaxID=36330 RepID=A0A1A8YJ33_PLAOA|nr:PIR Superfamily Protein [Plasmodium ovale wallikeri]SBT31548.1 PIR Superfamily Protein [Plasmodium ovale wallikeri]SBT74232.1 PIR protein [Plasmodium ovale]